jgi:hypothetical protein
MGTSGAPDGRPPGKRQLDARLAEGLQPEAKPDSFRRRRQRRPSETTSTNPPRPTAHADASVHADWTIDPALARQKLDKWLRSLGGVSNEAFTAPEQKELLQRITALQDEVKCLTSLNDKQSKAVLGMLGQAQQDSKRLGRKDWLLAGIGTGTALVITGVVPRCSCCI